MHSAINAFLSLRARGQIILETQQRCDPTSVCDLVFEPQEFDGASLKRDSSE
jgi:hypothetical protein